MVSTLRCLRSDPGLIPDPGVTTLFFSCKNGLRARGTYAWPEAPVQRV